jgi:polyphosphate kinase
MEEKVGKSVSLDSPEAYVNRELSWLNFAHRVLCFVKDPGLPLLERIKFAGIMGMLHDEFFMKRIGGLKRRIKKGSKKRSHDGRSPLEELKDCRRKLLAQVKDLSLVINRQIRPSLAKAGIPILDYRDLTAKQRARLKKNFTRSVLPILTPLAVDAAHPFPFIRGQGLNLAVLVKEGRRERFVRIKVPANRDRWVPLENGRGFVPLEQVIAANLDSLFPPNASLKTYFFRVTRGAQGELDHRSRTVNGTDAHMMPGSIIRYVTDELKARRFAGVVRLEVSSDMPKKLKDWLADQLQIRPTDLYVTHHLLGIDDLLKFPVQGYEELRDPVHTPVTHTRLRGISAHNPERVFEEIRRGDILLHHPYHSFDTSVLKFLQSAAEDPKVLAIKLTIYRTSSDSPMIQALLEAARAGKQVAVLVEITARFDEAPNIAWGKLLEKEGVHVSYGVEKLKTHVKLAMVVREEKDGIRRYVHVGTGNYHTGTARAYEDLGILSCDSELGTDVASVFNELTGATAGNGYRKMLVAPRYMGDHFRSLIQREARNAKKGIPSGVRAKMNQLQDFQTIRELYRASMAGVPISLNVRGLCCLRPGVPGLSENIRVFSVLGRFLEHGRIFRFENGGKPEFYIGSADWMKRNLERRVETCMPVTDPGLQKELDEILAVFENDNRTAWDMQPDGTYKRRRPEKNEEPRPSQNTFIRLYQKRESSS